MQNANAREVRRLNGRLRQKESELHEKDGLIRAVRAETMRFRLLHELLEYSLRLERENWAKEEQKVKNSVKSERKKIEKQEQRRRYSAAVRMCDNYGWSSAVGRKKQDGWAAYLTGRRERRDDDMFDAALGFWLSAQKECISGKSGRAGSVFREDLLYDLVKFSTKGKLWERIKKDVQIEVRANPILMAKQQDMTSDFNSRALQGIRVCLPGYTKWARGLVIPSQTCVDTQKEIVRSAGEKCFGSIFPPEDSGQLWRWDMAKGIHAYLKLKYYDLKSEKKSRANPWLVVATGDAARVSQRGATVTICGLKVCDTDHPEMQGTGKLFSQSWTTYTPTICALRGKI